MYWTLASVLRKPAGAFKLKTVGGMGTVAGITAAPFESEALKSEMVREELAKLIKDHKVRCLPGFCNRSVTAI